jgi:hypothetical protein
MGLGGLRSTVHLLTGTPASIAGLRSPTRWGAGWTSLKGHGFKACTFPQFPVQVGTREMFRVPVANHAPGHLLYHVPRFLPANNGNESRLPNGQNSIHATDWLTVPTELGSFEKRDAM